MTFGTAKVFRASTRIDKGGNKVIKVAISIPVDVVDEQKIEPGCKVEFDMRRMNIPIEAPKHKGGFKKKEEENGSTEQTTY